MSKKLTQVSKKEDEVIGLSEDQKKKGQEVGEKIAQILKETGFKLSVEFIYAPTGIGGKVVLALDE